MSVTMKGGTSGMRGKDCRPPEVQQTAQPIVTEKPKEAVPPPKNSPPPIEGL